jgi:hypothetical protein
MFIGFFRFNRGFKASGVMGLILVVIISSVFVLKTFGLDFVNGTSSYWQTQVDDVTQYISGFNMYISSPWKFPLLYFDKINFPEGTIVTFVDAIPLYSFFLKLILPSDVIPFNPFGYWVALCFIMQGIVAWYITRVLKIDSWFFLLFLTVVFVSYPSLMARLGHISLMSHWLILLSFAFYIKSYRGRSLVFICWTLLLVSAFYINIYIFVMVCGIYLSSLLSMMKESYFNHELYKFVLSFFIVISSTALMIFPLPQGDITREWGFGYYSMNVLSPFLGGRLFSLQADVAPGQYEGFNYLGLGLIISMLVSYVIIRRHNYINKHLYLFVVMALFTVYALSDHIYIGSQKILVVSYPGILDGLTSQFRASGRFFWPVGYGLAIASILIIYRNFKRYYFVAFCLILIILQILDVGDRYRVLVDTSRREFVEKLDYTLWDNVIHKNINKLYYYPKFKCGLNPHETLLPVMRYAAERNLNLNTGYVARYTPSCTTVETDIKEADKNISAFIFSKLDYPDLGEVADLFSKIEGYSCSEVQFSYICQVQEIEK